MARDWDEFIVELHYGTVWGGGGGSEFCPSYLHNIVIANKKARASSKQPHIAIRNNTDPAFIATLKQLIASYVFTY